MYNNNGETYIYIEESNRVGVWSKSGKHAFIILPYNKKNSRHRHAKIYKNQLDKENNYES